MTLYFNQNKSSFDGETAKIAIDADTREELLRPAARQLANKIAQQAYGIASPGFRDFAPQIGLLNPETDEFFHGTGLPQIKQGTPMRWRAVYTLSGPAG